MRNKGRLKVLFDNDYNMFYKFIVSLPGQWIKFGFDTPEDMWNANPEVIFE